MKIIDKILSYRCTLIGFDVRNERTIKEIVKHIPNKIVFDGGDFTNDEIMESFTEKQVIRQIKLMDILGESGNVNIILNLNNLKNEGPNKHKRPGLASIILEYSLNYLNSKLYQISDSNRNIKLILLSSMNTSKSGEYQIRGGASAICASDYFVIFDQNKLIVMKDREDLCFR